MKIKLNKNTIIILIVAIVILYLILYKKNIFENFRTDRRLITSKDRRLQKRDVTVNLPIKQIILQRTDNKNTHINILEIEVYDNLGMKINTGIIPRLAPQYGDPRRFGPQFLINNQWPNNSSQLPHTNGTKDAYMELELDSSQLISKIVVRNRLDCCKDRIRGTSLILKTDNNREISRVPINKIQDIYTFVNDDGRWALV